MQGMGLLMNRLKKFLNGIRARPEPSQPQEVLGPHLKDVTAKRFYIAEEDFQKAKRALLWFSTVVFLIAISIPNIHSDPKNLAENIEKSAKSCGLPIPTLGTNELPLLGILALIIPVFFYYLINFTILRNRQKILNLNFIKSNDNDGEKILVSIRENFSNTITYLAELSVIYKDSRDIFPEIHNGLKQNLLGNEYNKKSVHELGKFVDQMAQEFNGNSSELNIKDYLNGLNQIYIKIEALSESFGGPTHYTSNLDKSLSKVEENLELSKKLLGEIDIQKSKSKKIF